MAVTKIFPNKKSDYTDRTLQSIRREIDEYQIQCIENFGIHLTVTRKADAREVHNDEGVWTGYNRYTFSVWGKFEESISVRLEVNGKVRIFYSRQWCTISRFMDKFHHHDVTGEDPPAALTPDQKQVLWNNMFRWWMANKKVFRFLNLSPEIREMIYGLLFGTQQVEPYPMYRCNKRPKRTRAMIAVTQPSLNLLRVNRRIHEEASHVLFRNVTLLIEHAGIFVSVLKNTSLCTQVRSLKLALDLEDYLMVFGGKTKKYPTPPLHYSCSSLRIMKLRHLELQIPPPCEGSDIHRATGFWREEKVEEMFNLVWCFIKGHNVQITGSLDPSQRTELESKCRTELETYHKWRELEPLGYEVGSLKEYDEWAKEEEGGVRLCLY